MGGGVCGSVQWWIWDMRRADTVAMGDGGQSLNVRTQNLLERAGLGLAQLREFRGDVRNGAVVLADLDARHADTGLTSSLGRGSVAIARQRPGHGLGTGGERRTNVDPFSEPRSEGFGAMLGEGDHSLLAAGVAQVAQCGAGEIVVGVGERGPAFVGQCVSPGGAAAAAVC